MNIAMVILSGNTALITAIAWAVGGNPWLAFLCGANLVVFIAGLRDVLNDTSAW